MNNKQTLSQAIAQTNVRGTNMARAGVRMIGVLAQPCAERSEALNDLDTLLPSQLVREYTTEQFVAAAYTVPAATGRYVAKP